MKTKTKEVISILIRNRFDSLTMSWEMNERKELIEAAEEVDPILAHEMKSDEKF